MVSDKKENQGREFVITYYVNTEEVKVFETPKRNSGIKGGKFLDKNRYKN